MELPEGHLILAAHVDDIPVLSENDDARKKAKLIWSKCFECKHLGRVSYMLGVKFCHSDDGSITLSQKSYIEHLLQRFGMGNAKGAETPLGMRPLLADNGKSRDATPNAPYRELTGDLLYLVQRT
ncbi:reverse transcriptase [Trichuris suis]|nr:reverse transcriptase [Trichuris suis]